MFSSLTGMTNLEEYATAGLACFATILAPLVLAAAFFTFDTITRHFRDGIIHLRRLIGLFAACLFQIVFPLATFCFAICSFETFETVLPFHALTPRILDIALALVPVTTSIIAFVWLGKLGFCLLELMIQPIVQGQNVYKALMAIVKQVVGAVAQNAKKFLPMLAPFIPDAKKFLPMLAPFILDVMDSNPYRHVILRETKGEKTNPEKAAQFKGTSSDQAARLNSCASNQDEEEDEAETDAVRDLPGSW